MSAHDSPNREAGVFAYNHNLNTSERFYREICTTHTFRDRVATLQRAKAAGLSPCCGALFGMGEESDDIIALAYGSARARRSPTAHRGGQGSA
jgi:biotin synthase